MLIIVSYILYMSVHRRRTKTEDKAKVVAIVWGTYLNAALTN